MDFIKTLKCFHTDGFCDAYTPLSSTFVYEEKTSTGRRKKSGVFRGSVMEVHHPVFYASLGHMQNNMCSSVTLKLKLALTLTLTDKGGAVLTLMLGYRPGGELP